MPPQKLAGFFDDVAKIAADLRANGPTADELARAKTPRVDAVRKAQVTNSYWLSELSGSEADPRRLDFIREFIPGTEKVTAADVQRAAGAFLRDERGWRFEVLPASARP